MRSTRSLALLVLPSLFARALSAAHVTCAADDKGASTGNQWIQGRATLKAAFVKRPLPQGYADLVRGQRQRVNTSELVSLPLSGPPDVKKELFIYGYPVEEDRVVSGSVLKRGSWEGDGVKQICEPFQQNPGKGFNFLDVGGNIGTITLPVAALLEQTGGRVFTVEAMPSIGEHLKAGIVENGLRNVDLYSYAVSDPTAKDDLVMARHPTNKGASAVVGNKDWTTTSTQMTRVQLTTLDAMLGQEPGLRRVLVAKLDIEGHEGRALQGARRLLREAAPCYMMIELHASWLESAGTPIQDVVRQLADAGYDTRQISLSGVQTYWLKQVDMKGCLARLVAAGGPAVSLALPPP